MRSCIIGCGNIAGINDTVDSTGVLSHAKALSIHSHFSLQGCYDTDPTQCQQFSKRWSIDKAHTNLEEVLAEDYELYVIASSTSSHAGLLHKLFETSASVIVCEKPLVAYPEELEIMETEFLTSDKSIFINFTRRFDRSHQRLKEYLDKKPLGKLLGFSARTSKGLIHNGSHMIDLLQWFFGRSLNISRCYGSVSSSDVTGVFKISLAEESNGTLTIYKDVGYSFFELDLVFESGRVKIDNIGYRIEVFDLQDSKFYAGVRELQSKEVYPATYSEALYYLYESVASGENREHHLNDVIFAMNAMFSCLAESEMEEGTC